MAKPSRSWWDDLTASFCLSQIVLIGDHKQLQPVVRNECVRKLGMARSLFERYHDLHEKRAVMLNTQYRMVRTLQDCLTILASLSIDKMIRTQ